LRGSSISSGLITPDGPVPIQATFTTPAVSGGGLTTNTFVVLNMALQHEDPVDAATYLAATNFTTSSSYFLWALTRNEDIRVTPDDYAFIPFYTHASAFAGVTTPQPYRIVVMIEGDATKYYPRGTGFTSTLLDKKVYYLPIGIKNLKLMPGYNLPLDYNKRYRVGIEIPTGGIIIFITPFISIDKATGNHKRIFFRNYLGHFEGINFSEYDEANTAVSGAWERAIVQVPPTSGNKSQRGMNRFNVRSNETGTLYASFPEDMMWLISQLNGSPDAYMQWKGTNGQGDDQLPIIILDAAQELRKVDGRYSYDVAVKYAMANPNIHTRN
jgi:hypothetical protein